MWDKSRLILLLMYIAIRGEALYTGINLPLESAQELVILILLKKNIRKYH
jgi:hypothetical protein